MAKVELKQPIIDEIKDILDGAASAVTVEYLGINVADDTRLRKELRENNVKYKVFKNTLIKRAVDGTEFAELTPGLMGSTAIAVSKDDATAPARIISKYMKDIAVLKIKGGVVEGKFYDADKMSELAKIPSRDELLSKLLGSLQSPITNFARVLKQVADKAPAAEAPAEAPAPEVAPVAEAPAEAAPAPAAEAAAENPEA